MPLTDLECRKAKADQKLLKLSDMGGLQLWVYPTGSKLWRFACQIASNGAPCFAFKSDPLCM